MAVTDGEELLWCGDVYFAYRGRLVQNNDGAHDEISARATTHQDLTHLFDRFNGAELEFAVNGRRYGLASFRPAYNPDGSFHHITFSLMERGCDA